MLYESTVENSIPQHIDLCHVSYYINLYQEQIAQQDNHLIKGFTTR